MTAAGTFQETLLAKVREAQDAQGARGARRRIVLPESGDARVLAAAARAQADGVADCLLLGDADAVGAAARAAEVVLPPTVSIVAPDVAGLAPSLAALRAHKGLDEDAAAAWLRDDAVAVAAMMVKNGDADGMVAGAATATAAVLRPVLQIIGMAAGASLASSFFLMCFPEEEGGGKIFADCALNAQPTPAQLADIAAQSADSARRFGITPVVAMLSYATGDSAGGDAVARAREAARLARVLLPDTPVAGPIQYDAAVSPAIAAQKMPEWTAGSATVLIFPDLNAGNITYKAVQQAARIVAVGPLLQGLAAPANDLSRGATTEDIYWTIAATAAQADG